MKLNIAIGSNSFKVEVVEGPDAITTFGELNHFISEHSNLDPTCMKIIHRGKTLAGNDDTSLEEFKFKENDKLLVMGKTKVALKDDPGFASLVKYEKDHLIGLQKQHDELVSDVAELEKNFLCETKSREMVKRMDKRLKIFAEVCLRHLESIDGLKINSEDTSDEQAQRNREKRKALVKGIQSLMDLCDKNVRRLEEYQQKLDGEIIA